MAHRDKKVIHIIYLILEIIANRKITTKKNT